MIKKELFIWNTQNKNKTVVGTFTLCANEGFCEIHFFTKMVIVNLKSLIFKRLSFRFLQQEKKGFAWNLKSFVHSEAIIVVSKPAKIQTDLVNGFRETVLTATALFLKSSFEIIACKGGLADDSQLQIARYKELPNRFYCSDLYNFLEKDSLRYVLSESAIKKFSIFSINTNVYNPLTLLFRCTDKSPSIKFLE